MAEWTVGTPLITLTADLGLSTRVSKLQYVILATGTSSGRAASGGDLAPELPHATFHQPETIGTVEANGSVFSPYFCCPSF